MLDKWRKLLVVMTTCQIRRLIRKGFWELTEQERVFGKREGEMPEGAPARGKAGLLQEPVLFLEAPEPTLPPAPIGLSFPQAEAECQHPAARPGRHIRDRDHEPRVSRGVKCSAPIKAREVTRWGLGSCLKAQKHFGKSQDQP